MVLFSSFSLLLFLLLLLLLLLVLLVLLLLLLLLSWFGERVLETETPKRQALGRKREKKRIKKENKRLSHPEDSWVFLFVIICVYKKKNSPRRRRREIQVSHRKEIFLLQCFFFFKFCICHISTITRPLLLVPFFIFIFIFF